MRSLALSTVTIAIVIGVARGDAPLPPATKTTVASPNGDIRAVSDPKTGTEIQDVKQHKVLWRLPNWYRSMFVANDGKHLVTEYVGLNLIPLNFKDDLVLITFWHEGKKMRQVTVGNLFPNHSILLRTASHYAWGHVDGIDGVGRLKVRRIDGKQFLYDVATGKKPKA